MFVWTNSWAGIDPNFRGFKFQMDHVPCISGRSENVGGWDDEITGGSFLCFLLSSPLPCLKLPSGNQVYGHWESPIDQYRFSCTVSSRYFFPRFSSSTLVVKKSLNPPEWCEHLHGHGCDLLPVRLAWRVLREDGHIERRRAANHSNQGPWKNVCFIYIHGLPSLSIYIYIDSCIMLYNVV